MKTGKNRFCKWVMVVSLLVAGCGDVLVDSDAAGNSDSGSDTTSDSTTTGIAASDSDSNGAVESGSDSGSAVESGSDSSGPPECTCTARDCSDGITIKVTLGDNTQAFPEGDYALKMSFAGTSVQLAPDEIWNGWEGLQPDDRTVLPFYISKIELGTTTGDVTVQVFRNNIPLTTPTTVTPHYVTTVCNYCTGSCGNDLVDNALIELTAAIPEGTECVAPADCLVMNDCCGCGAYPTDTVFSSCPMTCDVSECDVNSIPSDHALCVNGYCVLDVNCDSSEATCRVAIPKCAGGEVPVVNEAGDCWTGECVSASECRNTPTAYPGVDAETDTQ